MKNLIFATLLSLSLFSLPASAQSANSEQSADSPQNTNSEQSTDNLLIEMATDLAKDGRDSKQNQRPIVLFITAVDCPFCEQLRQEYFKFSTKDPRFILREIELGVGHDVVNFDGKWANHQLIADRYNAYVTPTAMFVGPDGAALNKPIIGILTMDYYHFYFEKALKASTARLKNGETSDPS